MKLWRQVCNQHSNLAFQEELTPPQSWEDEDELSFNTSKCKIAHLKYVADHEHIIDNYPLELSQVEKHLGVLVPHDPQFYISV